MPRRARIDAPGALQHIIVRGIAQQVIFRDDVDRYDLLDRLDRLLAETETPCYAWALMPNHVHLLLRTGTTPIAGVMRRLLTGYAVGFNRRHKRHGHLFQNRYKSILCEETRYLRQLVGYIHLNPYRGRIVDTVDELGRYPFSGHCALMGHKRISWQDCDHILALFGKTQGGARKRYAAYVAKWAAKGPRPELTGGGLIRSAGGWRAVRQAHRQGVRLAGDERMLGSSDFVAKTLADAGETLDRRMRLQAGGIDLDAVIKEVAGRLNLKITDLESGSRSPAVCRGRALAGHIALKSLAIPGAEVARRFHVDRSSVCRAVQRIEKDVRLKMECAAIVNGLFAVDGDG